MEFHYERHKCKAGCLYHTAQTESTLRILESNRNLLQEFSGLFEQSYILQSKVWLLTKLLLYQYMLSPNSFEVSYKNHEAYSLNTYAWRLYWFDHHRIILHHNSIWSTPSLVPLFPYWVTYDWESCPYNYSRYLSKACLWQNQRLQLSRVHLLDFSRR